MSYTPTIGLEIHVELNTKTKMFCGCLNDPDEKRPNKNVCPVCIAFPGNLPVANKAAIEKVILTGLAFGSNIARETNFDRKHYFYPDLPKGYQISQYARPFCSGGKVELSDGKIINLTRIHLEEDTGRSQHDQEGDHSLVDFNRAGVPLMELVTEPDFTSGAEVEEFAKKLQLTLRYLGVSEVDMEKGQMRVEVNISLSNKEKEISNKFGTKVEIKNLNSIKAAAASVDYEIARQTELLNKGEKVDQETRGWDDSRQRTVSQRSKESAHDYRYFPEPDLPEFKFDKAQIEGLRLKLPELPEQKLERFAKEYGLPAADVSLLVSEPPLASYFENIISELRTWDKLAHLTRPGEEHFAKLVKLTANYLLTELKRLLNEDKLNMADMGVTAENFAEFIVRIFHQEISSSAAQTLLAEMLRTGQDPAAIIQEKDLAQVSDEAGLIAIITQVIEKNAKAVADYKAGKTEVLKFLVGQVMAASRGKANPATAEKLLQESLR